jgi:hypothetical protein
MSVMQKAEFLDFVTKKVGEGTKDSLDAVRKLLMEDSLRIEHWIMANLDDWVILAVKESDSSSFVYYTGELAKEVVEHLKKVFLEQEPA